MCHPRAEHKRTHYPTETATDENLGRLLPRRLPFGVFNEDVEIDDGLHVGMGQFSVLAVERLHFRNPIFTESFQVGEALGSGRLGHTGAYEMQVVRRDYLEALSDSSVRPMPGLSVTRPGHLRQHHRPHRPIVQVDRRVQVVVAASPSMDG